MGKKSDTTIENRVYLFESLASSYVASATEVLSSEDPAVRQRARRALAELAFVSCVMADTSHLPAEQVRAQVLGAPERVPEAPSKVSGAAARKRNK